MSGAVRSKLDPSVLQAMRMRRRRAETRAAEKLEILRRLYLQHVACDLPKQPETRVEQSFNEQLFARVFDYETLLSHGRVPFHLQPKTYGRGHYDDFSLGLFYGSAEDVHIASAELKPANTNLDAPQAGSGYDGLTPVQQAFRRARERASCRWVIVSNFSELRLYDVRDEREPIAVADLHEVRNPNDLALLLAHFDRRALLRIDGTEAEMTTALDPTHPQHPIPPAQGSHRLVLRFAPRRELTMSLYDMEVALTSALQEVERAKDFFGQNDLDGAVIIPRIEMREGWVSVEAVRGDLATRLAMSSFGEVQLTVRRRTPTGNDGITPYTLKKTASFFCHFLNRAHFSLGWEAGKPLSGEGLVSAELRELDGAKLWDQRGDSVNIGYAPVKDLQTIDFTMAPFGLFTDGRVADCRGAAACVCELAIQFRQREDGMGIRLDRTEVEKEISPKPGPRPR
jgi:hypothetical protein